MIFCINWVKHVNLSFQWVLTNHTRLLWGRLWLMSSVLENKHNISPNNTGIREQRSGKMLRMQYWHLFCKQKTTCRKASTPMSFICTKAGKNKARKLLFNCLRNTGHIIFLSASLYPVLSIYLCSSEGSPNKIAHKQQAPEEMLAGHFLHPIHLATVVFTFDTRIVQDAWRQKKNVMVSANRRWDALHISNYRRKSLYVNLVHAVGPSTLWNRKG